MRPEAAVKVQRKLGRLISLAQTERAAVIITTEESLFQCAFTLEKAENLWRATGLTKLGRPKGIMTRRIASKAIPVTIARRNDDERKRVLDTFVGGCNQ